MTMMTLESPKRIAVVETMTTKKEVPSWLAHRNKMLRRESLEFAKSKNGNSAKRPLELEDSQSTWISNTEDYESESHDFEEAWRALDKMNSTSVWESIKIPLPRPGVDDDENDDASISPSTKTDTDKNRRNHRRRSAGSSYDSRDDSRDDSNNARVNKLLEEHARQQRKQSKEQPPMEEIETRRTKPKKTRKRKKKKKKDNHGDHHNPSRKTSPNVETTTRIEDLMDEVKKLIDENRRLKKELRESTSSRSLDSTINQERDHIKEALRVLKNLTIKQEVSLAAMNQKIEQQRKEIDEKNQIIQCMELQSMAFMKANNCFGDLLDL